MKNISKLTEQERKNIIGKLYNDELINQYDWMDHYPLVNEEMIITDILNIHDTWNNDIVIDASNNYARHATAEEIDYNRRNPGAWPNTVMQ